MFKIKSGSRRTVFIFKKRVIKIPKLSCWVSFIRGVNENLEERYWYSADGSRKRYPNSKWSENYDLAEIFWADRFGFFVVMEKLDTSFMKNDYEVKDEWKERIKHEMESLKIKNKGLSFIDDMKPANLGFRDDRLIFLDYGFFGGMKDCYIGN